MRGGGRLVTRTVTLAVRLYMRSLGAILNYIIRPSINITIPIYRK